MDSSPNVHEPSLLIEKNGINNALTPRIGLVDTSLGVVTAAPAWFIDNRIGTFRIFRQPNISTAGATYFHIDTAFNVGIGGGMTTAPGPLISSGGRVPHLSVMFATGNVGIGNVAPAYRLDVAGDVNVALGSGFRENGTCLIGGCMSDKTMKRNIKPLSGSLEKITQLQPVEFNFIDDHYGPGKQVGLIAQEVEQDFPEWVTAGNDGIKKIHYGLQIQMLLIGATKELKAELDTLREQNKTLKDRLDDLENKL